MFIIGVNLTKDAAFFAHVDYTAESFAIKKIDRLQFELRNADDLSDLLMNVSTILNQYTEHSLVSVAILKCMGGQYGSSIEAIKAEAVVELAAHQKFFKISMITSHSLKKALGCDNKEKWQDKSKQIFNSGNTHKFWSQGANGAVCAAYKLVRD